MLIIYSTVFNIYMLLAPNIGNEKNVLLKSFLKSGACLEPS